MVGVALVDGDRFEPRVARSKRWVANARRVASRSTPTEDVEPQLEDQGTSRREVTDLGLGTVPRRGDHGREQRPALEPAESTRSTSPYRGWGAQLVAAARLHP